MYDFAITVYHISTHNAIVKGGEKVERFYSIKEVSEMQEVHTNTVRSWIAKGWLKAHKIGGRIRIYESDLQAFLNRDGNDQR